MKAATRTADGIRALIFLRLGQTPTLIGLMRNFHRDLRLVSAVLLVVTKAKLIAWHLVVELLNVLRVHFLVLLCLVRGDLR